MLLNHSRWHQILPLEQLDWSGQQLQGFLSDAVSLKMAELGEATVNRILHQKSCSEGEYLKELLNSRNNEEIVNHLKDSNRPREDLQVLQKSKNWSQVTR